MVHAAKLANLGYWVWDEINDRAIFCSDEVARIFGYESGLDYTAVSGGITFPAGTQMSTISVPVISPTSWHPMIDAVLPNPVM